RLAVKGRLCLGEERPGSARIVELDVRRERWRRGLRRRYRGCDGARWRGGRRRACRRRADQSGEGFGRRPAWRRRAENLSHRRQPKRYRARLTDERLEAAQRDQKKSED